MDNQPSTPPPPVRDTEWERKMLLAPVKKVVIYPDIDEQDDHHEQDIDEQDDHHEQDINEQDINEQKEQADQTNQDFIY